MKWFILFLFTSVAFADSLRLGLGDSANDRSFIFSKKAFVENGELNMGYQVACQENDLAYCQALCGQNSCVVSKDSCDSCVSSSNLNVFALFRDFSKLFLLTKTIIDWSPIFVNLRSEEWRILDENAILNLFEDTQSEEKYTEARKKFLASCPAGATKAFLIVESKTLVPQVYICQGPYDQSVYITALNIEFSR